MATRFYLPSSGTPPLSSLGVSGSWTRSDALVRLPCDIEKKDTGIYYSEKTSTWQTTSTVGWVWAQFQSPPMLASYNWTTSDTVSMVIKVQEQAPQTDSHLAYVIRVVSKDGTAERGIIGAYLATSTEYATSYATRIHSARTNGATNFTSQIGDRIIIEIGHWGVTPTLSNVYHQYGDLIIDEDYALTAGLTTDLNPWVELSRTVSFYVRSSQSAYMKGGAGFEHNIFPTTYLLDNFNRADGPLGSMWQSSINAQTDAAEINLVDNRAQKVLGGLGDFAGDAYYKRLYSLPVEIYYNIPIYTHNYIYSVEWGQNAVAGAAFTGIGGTQLNINLGAINDVGANFLIDVNFTAITAIGIRLLKDRLDAYYRLDSGAWQYGGSVSYSSGDFIGRYEYLRFGLNSQGVSAYMYADDFSGGRPWFYLQAYLKGGIGIKYDTYSPPLLDDFNRENQPLTNSSNWEAYDPNGAPDPPSDAVIVNNRVEFLRFAEFTAWVSNFTIPFDIKIQVPVLGSGSIDFACVGYENLYGGFISLGRTGIDPSESVIQLFFMDTNGEIESPWISYAAGDYVGLKINHQDILILTINDISVFESSRVVIFPESEFKLYIYKNSGNLTLDNFYGGPLSVRGQPAYLSGPTKSSQTVYLTGAYGLLIDHETGNTSQYTGGATSNIVSSAAALVGSYGLEIVGTTRAYRAIDQASTNGIHFRMYVDPNSYDKSAGILLAVLSSGSSQIMNVGLLKTDGQYFLRIYTEGLIGQIYIPISDEPHILETHTTSETELHLNNGTLTIWVDQIQWPIRTNLNTGFTANYVEGLTVGQITNVLETDKVYVDDFYITLSNQLVHKVRGAITPAYLNGQIAGTPASSFQETYSKGQDHEQTQIPVYLHGTADSQSNQPTYLYGQEEALNNIPAFTQAIQLSGSTTPAYLAGLSDASGTIPVYLGAWDQSKLSVFAFLSGEFSGLNLVWAFLKGQEDATSFISVYSTGSSSEKTSTPIYLQGQDYEIGSCQVYLEGQEGNPLSQTSAYLQGNSTTTSSLSIHITGGLTTTEKINSYLIGSDYASVQQGGYSHGQETIFSQISVNLSGQDTAGNIQSSYIHGSLAADSSAAGYLSGKASNSSSLPANLVGSTPNNVVIPGYLSGCADQLSVGTAYTCGGLVASQPTYLAGSQNESNTISAYLTAIDPLPSIVSGYLRGQAYTNLYTIAFLSGWDHTQSFISNYLRGRNLVTGMAGVYLQGSQLISNYRDVYLQGISEGKSNLSTYLEGQSGLPQSANPAYLTAQDTAQNSQTAHLGGELASSTSLNSYLTGSTQTVSQQSTYLTGEDYEQNQCHIYLSGRIDLSGIANGYTHGQVSEQSALSASLRGSTATTSNQPGYTEGYSQNSSSVPIYLQGQSDLTTSNQVFLSGGEISYGTQTGYLSGQSNDLGHVSAYLSGIDIRSVTNALLVGQAVTQTQQTAYAHGQILAQNSISAYTQGTIPLETNDQVSAFTAGIDGTQTSKSAYVYGFLDSVSIQSAYIEGAVASTQSGYTCGLPANLIDRLGSFIVDHNFLGSFVPEKSLLGDFSDEYLLTGS